MTHIQKVPVLVPLLRIDQDPLFNENFLVKIGMLNLIIKISVYKDEKEKKQRVRIIINMSP